MPFIPGLFATPTVIANALLSLTKDSSVPVIGPDRVGVVSPMFNEEASAAAALSSLLRQSSPIDEIVVSINGGSDATGEVVRRTLTEYGYRAIDKGHVPGATATYERWLLTNGPMVAVVEHAQPISKSDSINVALDGGLLNTERVLLVDGDTVFHEDFLAGLKANFYRLRKLGRGAKARFVLEDYAIQSGAVLSSSPGRGKPVGGLIHRARSAEYAISAVLRSGQTARFGASKIFGNSRLYTVVGCGFTTRRECFPMPSDTLTEDHDFTLAVQNGPVTETAISVDELRERGFSALVAGELVDVGTVTGESPITMRRGGNARFVSEALMFTDDPLSLPGYLRQIERWNGGGVENGLKRFFVPETWRGLRANVRFTLLAAHFENLLGLLLLLVMLPLAMGLNFALPGHGMPLEALLVWLGVDVFMTGLLAVWGFLRLGVGLGFKNWRLGGWVARQGARSVLALGVLRIFNAITFVTGGVRAVRSFSKRHELDPRTTITWERPHAKTTGRTQLRFFGGTGALLLVASSVFVVTAWSAGETRPGYRDTWRLINGSVPVLRSEHMNLPLSVKGNDLTDAEPDVGGSSTAGEAPVAAANAAPEGAAGQTELGAAGAAEVAEVAEAVEAAEETIASSESTAVTEVDVPSEAVAKPIDDLLNSPLASLGLQVTGAKQGPRRVSAYCGVDAVARPASGPRLLDGQVADYTPLSAWGLLVLARLAPLVANIEVAATAYDVSPDLLLRVLLNESYLDPLAIGPTGDLGLSQVTNDALTLIKAISVDPLSPFANSTFFAGTFSVFDPDFSICAGAAKLAWAQAQPDGDDEHFAYARYINPLEGVVRGKISQRHSELVMAIDDLKPLAKALAATIAAFREDPANVTNEERALLGVTKLVADGTVTVGQAYFVTAELVQSFQIKDVPLYDSIRNRLYGESYVPTMPRSTPADQT